MSNCGVDLPGSAADALVGIPGFENPDLVGEERVQGDPRGPWGPPHYL
jgi:hypothetical protein